MQTIERIAPRSADLGEGMTIRRVLPTRARRMVGAWCFLDHLGPVEFAAGAGMRVRAHPHIGLQTFTWMIEGEILHRDSLGSEQVVRPGQVNLMTAGHGIVHTEDGLTPRIHAAQLWIALPPHLEDRAPAFEHYPELPRWTENGVALTLLAGSLAGRRAPTAVQTPLLGLDLSLPGVGGAAGAIDNPGGARLVLPLDPTFEYGLLALEGSFALSSAAVAEPTVTTPIASERFAADEFACFGPGMARVVLGLQPGSRVLLLGGEPYAATYGAPVTMAWNFVASDRARISAAQAEWEQGTPRFGRVEGDEGIRLPAPPLPWRG